MLKTISKSIKNHKKKEDLDDNRFKEKKEQERANREREERAIHETEERSKREIEKILNREREERANREKKIMEKHEHNKLIMDNTEKYKPMFRNLETIDDPNGHKTTAILVDDTVICIVSHSNEGLIKKTLGVELCAIMKRDLDLQQIKISEIEKKQDEMIRMLNNIKYMLIYARKN